MKNPVTEAEIKPATFRIVAEHINYCATAVPGLGMDYPYIHMSIFQHMLERTDAIKNEVLESITFVLAYATVYISRHCTLRGKRCFEISLLCRWQCKSEEWLVHFRGGSEERNKKWRMNRISSSLKENSYKRKWGPSRLNEGKSWRWISFMAEHIWISHGYRPIAAAPRRPSSGVVTIISIKCLR